MRRSSAMRLSRSLFTALALMLTASLGCWEQWSEDWFPQMKWQKAVQAFEAVEFGDAIPRGEFVEESRCHMKIPGPERLKRCCELLRHVRSLRRPALRNAEWFVNCNRCLTAGDTNSIDLAEGGPRSCQICRFLGHQHAGSCHSAILTSPDRKRGETHA